MSEKLPESISGPPFHKALPWLLFISTVFFLCFLARIIFSPLLPGIESETGISHAQATRFFFFISGGYSIGLLSSGLFTCRFHHQTTVCISAAWVGLCLIALAFMQSLWLIYLTLLIFGLGAGLYLPSGISVVVALVKPSDTGKAISIHELAPTGAFLAAPFLVELLLRWMNWRWILAAIGVASLIICLCFALFGRGNKDTTRPPRLSHFLVFFQRSSFWTLASVACMGIAASMGIFSVLPIFLIDEHGYSAEWANTLTALSRVGCPLAALLSGWLTDRIGPVRTMTINIVLTALCTILLGLLSGHALVVVVLLQAMPSAAIFPAYYAMLSSIFPPEERNVAISLIVPVGVFCGAGVTPALIGILADLGLFQTGFVGVGLLCLAIYPLLRFLRSKTGERF